MRLAARGCIVEGGRPWRNVWGGAFCNRMAAANEATKNIKIKIRRGLKWPQNVEQNATINNKNAASMDGRWDGTRERRGAQGGRDSIILGANELKGGGGTKMDQFIKLYYFSANLENKI